MLYSMEHYLFSVIVKLLVENIVLMHPLVVCVCSIHASNKGDMQVAILFLKHIIQKA